MHINSQQPVLCVCSPWCTEAKVELYPSTYCKMLVHVFVRSARQMWSLWHKCQQKAGENLYMSTAAVQEGSLESISYALRTFQVMGSFFSYSSKLCGFYLHKIEWLWPLIIFFSTYSALPKLVFDWITWDSTLSRSTKEKQL